MTVSKQIGIFLVAVSVSLFALELGEALSIPGYARLRLDG